MFRLIAVFWLFAVPIFANAGAEFEKIFEPRSKCAVAVQYVVELEESRSKRQCVGMVAGDDGLVIVNSAEIPGILRLESLKDFKVRIFGGDPEGYPADYLGADRITGTHFIKIRGGLKAGMRPFNSFPRANCHMGDSLWGVVLDSESADFEPMMDEATLIRRGKYPLYIGCFSSPVASNSAPVFDKSGNFAGWAASYDENDYILYAGDKSGEVKLLDPNRASVMFMPEVVDELLERIPENPAGDAFGWVGLIDLQILKSDVAKYLGLENKSAFVVSEIVKDSPAEKFGIKKGDIITGYNGKPIERLRNDLATLSNFWITLAKNKPGEKVSFEVISGNSSPRELEVVLDSSPKSFRQSKFKYFKRLGFSVREFLVDDSIARKTFRRGDDIAVVQFVKPNSPASSAVPAALKQDDLIKEINSVPVRSYAEAVDILDKLESDKSAKEIVILAEDFSETKVIRVKLD